MYKILFLGTDYAYIACNPTILNLSINKKDKFRIVGLQARVRAFIYL
jgi:hypothetical protein